MDRLSAMAEAALRGDSLALRSLYQDMMREMPRLVDCPPPATDDCRLLTAAAALVELMAERSQQAPPSWTASIGPLDEPTYLVPSAAIMKRLRILCETESPEPLRKRGFYAPPNFLEFA